MLAAIMGYSSKWMYTSHVQETNRGDLRMSTRPIELNKNQKKSKLELGCFIENLFFLKLIEESAFLHKNFLSLYNYKMMSVQ